MKGSENPDKALEERKKKDKKTSSEKKRSIIGVSISIVLLALILLIAFFVTPIVSRQTSGEILPSTIRQIVIESGEAKIEVGSRDDLNVIQYFLSGSAEMKWKVIGETLSITCSEGSLRVSLPTSLEINTLRILSTGKDILVNSTTADVIDLVNSADEIKVHDTDAGVLTAGSKGSIELEGSRIGSADLQSENDIRLRDSKVDGLTMRWTDQKADVKDSLSSTIRAESNDGKLSLRLINGIRSISINGEDQQVFPSESAGAKVAFITAGGEIETSPETLRQNQ